MFSLWKTFIKYPFLSVSGIFDDTIDDVRYVAMLHCWAKFSNFSTLKYLVVSVENCKTMSKFVSYE